MIEEKMTDIKAIMTYFSQGKHGRKVEMMEMKILPQSDRKELGQLCREELKK